MNSRNEILDVALIGGGVMSTTLGALLCKVLPDRSIALFERQGSLAGESSNAWNNAGTGHSGLCELNYMPDPEDPSTTAAIAEKFQFSVDYWSALTACGDLDRSFMNSVPHMNVVLGETDVDYLRRRWTTLQKDPKFSAMEFTEDLEAIAGWAPLLVKGRPPHERVAATRHEGGTDVDFGKLSRSQAEFMENRGCLIRTGHDITRIRRGSDGVWSLSGRIHGSRKRFHVRSRFVFVGAGGYALRMLQKARVREVRGYGVFPFGAQFLRTDRAEVVDRHDAKVYGKPALGAPPMSLPHLDKRIVDGEPSLMFGPYATFSTRLLKHGGLRDLFTTIRPGNVPSVLSVGVQNWPLVRYLVGQLVASNEKKFDELRRFCPSADPSDWYRIQAGQRAQLIKPVSRFRGELMFGTEIVTGEDGTIAGLLGASPGASVAPAAMVEVLQKCFEGDSHLWEPRLRALIPTFGRGDTRVG